jgi:ketosteroid isomerase-like protein
MKKTFLLLGTIFLISCNQKTEKIIDYSGNEKFIKTYFETFNKHDWKASANMYIDVAEFKDPSLGKGIVTQTRQQTIDKYTELNKIFPDLTDKVIAIYPSAKNHIVVEFISSGTAPDNTKFELPICTIFTTENGKITKDFTYFDNFEENNIE